MSRKKKEERKTQKGKFKNKLCFLAAAIAAGTITTEDKKLYGGEVCTVRVNGVTTGNPTTLGSAPLQTVLTVSQQERELSQDIQEV